MTREQRDPAARRKGNHQRGQATLEFALVSMTVLLFLVGTLDLGRAVYYYNVLANAARDGARYASVLDSTDWAVNGNNPGTYASAAPFVSSDTIVGATSRHTAGLDATGLKVTITTPQGTVPGFDLPVTVATQYIYNPIATTLLGIRAITVTAQSTMSIR